MAIMHNSIAAKRTQWHCQNLCSTNQSETFTQRKTRMKVTLLSLGSSDRSQPYSKVLKITLSWQQRVTRFCADFLDLFGVL